MGKTDKVNKYENENNFMLTEYETLREFRQNLISLGENRLNIFLTSVSGSYIGIGLIYQLNTNDEISSIISLLILIGIFLLGIFTLVRMVERSIGVTTYTRGLNRIRRYFVDNYPNIKDYISMPIFDDKPGYISRAFMSIGINSIGLPEIIIMINSIIFSTGVILLLGTFLSIPTYYFIIVGAVIFIIVLVIQRQYHISQLYEADKLFKPKYPSPIKDKSVSINKNN